MLRDTPIRFIIKILCFYFISICTHIKRGAVSLLPYPHEVNSYLRIRHIKLMNYWVKFRLNLRYSTRWRTSPKKCKHFESPCGGHVIEARALWFGSSTDLLGPYLALYHSKFNAHVSAIPSASVHVPGPFRLHSCKNGMVQRTVGQMQRIRSKFWIGPQDCFRLRLNPMQRSVGRYFLCHHDSGLRGWNRIGTNLCILSFPRRFWSLTSKRSSGLLGCSHRMSAHLLNGSCS